MKDNTDWVVEPGTTIVFHMKTDSGHLVTVRASVNASGKTLSITGETTTIKIFPRAANRVLVKVSD